MAQIETDLDIHRFIFQVSAQLKSATDPDKVLRYFLRSTAELMRADRACVAALETGDREAEALVTQPAGCRCDLDLVTRLLRQPGLPTGRGTICARITRRDRAWAMIVLEKDSGGFPDGHPRALAHIAEQISERLQLMDRDRLSEVRARIDGLMMRELPPKDLYYQILDGLHQLTRYDHSAALWIWQSSGTALELAAEQIAWRKMKSPMIGRTVALGSDLEQLLGDGMVYGFDRLGSGWREWTGHGAAGLPELLDLDDAPPSAERATNAKSATRSAQAGDVAERPHRPRECAVLCASLGAREGPLGILKLSALTPGRFGSWELEIVQRFTLLASLALQRAQTLEALQARILKVERQNALAHLARGVAHDINNALGEVIPLVQQIRSELRDEKLDPALLAEDLERVDHSLQVTRGIFGRMMRFARGTARGAGPGDARRAFEAVREVLRENLTRRGIRLRAEVPEDLPPVRSGQSDLERLFLNLMSNARDAMPDGGTLRIRAAVEGRFVEILIADDGVGMSPETLSEIERPFYTTKEHGTGLGLSTCRSIAAESGGDLSIESAIGSGTRVTARLAIATPAEDTER
jgi:signal transduction histidine kinase